MRLIGVRRLEASLFRNALEEPGNGRCATISRNRPEPAPYPPAGRIAGGAMITGPYEVRFAVKALPAAGARPNELTRTMAPHPLVHQELPTTPSTSSTTTA